MLKVEYVTKKVPVSIVPLVRVLQARLTLAFGRKVTEAEVFEEAVKELAQKPLEEKKYTLADLCGMIKGKPEYNSTKELNDVVYGKV